MDGSAARLVRVDGLSVRRRGQRVIETVSFDVPERGITAVLGPPGAGKSTLLAAINGGLWDDPLVKGSGQVWLRDVCLFPDRRDDLSLRRRLPLVFSHPHLFPGTVRKNLTLALDYHRLAPPSGREHYLVRLLALLGIEEGSRWLDERAERVPPEWAYRIALARSLALGPDLLLLDEPGADLGAHAATELEETLRGIARQTPLLLATQSPERAARLADVVAVVMDGELVEVGLAVRIFQNPRDVRTDRFLTGRR